MTISYSGNFVRLLLRWKGSIWKTTWKELLIFLIVYYAVRVFYHYLLPLYSSAAVEYFGNLVFEFDEYTTRIPIMFLLGFYVAAVVKRWWEQFELLGWPDDVINMLCYIAPEGTDDQQKLRQSVARYLLLTAVLSWREISVQVRKRFPSVRHVVEAELMTNLEHDLYKNTDQAGRWYLPLQWAQQRIQEHCKAQQTPAPLVSHLLQLLYKYRSGFKELHCYDWVCIPLVYTQVAAIATYGYFILCLIGRQFLLNPVKGPNGNCQHACVDYFIPIFTILEFLCYIGWFKVGQDIMRPFEEDDDDFELNYMIDRHIVIAQSLLNSACSKAPADSDDCRFWTKLNCVPAHTKLSSAQMYHPPKLHAYVTIRDPEDALKVGSAPVAAIKSRKQGKKLRFF